MRRPLAKLEAASLYSIEYCQRLLTYSFIYSKNQKGSSMENLSMYSYSWDFEENGVTTVVGHVRSQSLKWIGSVLASVSK